MSTPVPAPYDRTAPELTAHTLDRQGCPLHYFTAGPADLGFQYYCGYRHDPGFVYLSATEMELVYTRHHLFAGEAALAAGPFTLRAEAGYDLTGDTEGDDPALYNSRAV